jgi:hypothetical protein
MACGFLFFWINIKKFSLTYKIHLVAGSALIWCDIKLRNEFEDI